MYDNQNTAYREIWKDEYLALICGLANAQGGRLYIGKKDDGGTLDPDNAKKLKEDLPDKIKSSLEIAADVNLLEEKGLQYIEIAVSPRSTPVSYNGKYYCRSGSTNQRLDGIGLMGFLLLKEKMHWDDITVAGISPDDLDKESFDIFRREALRSKRMTEQDLNIPNGELLEKLDLISDGKLKRGGALCFYRDAEKIANGCYVRIGKFDGCELLYQDEVHGSLILMADRVIDLIYLKYLKAKVSYYKETRVETYPFARDAIREAVFNALIHCDWAGNIPIQICIEEDAMYISNSSQLPSGWTAETLMGTHASKPLNPNIARVFYHAGYIENRGCGVRKICEACKAFGADNPEYTVNGADIMLTFNALKNTGTSDSGTLRQEGRGPGKTGKSFGNKILEIIRADAFVTISEIADMLMISKRKAEREMRNLHESGCLIRQGGKRYGHWLILNDK